MRKGRRAFKREYAYVLIEVRDLFAVCLDYLQEHEAVLTRLYDQDRPFDYDEEFKRSETLAGVLVAKGIDIAGGHGLMGSLTFLEIAVEHERFEAGLPYCRNGRGYAESAAAAVWDIERRGPYTSFGLRSPDFRTEGFFDRARAVRHMCSIILEVLERLWGSKVTLVDARHGSAGVDLIGALELREHPRHRFPDVRGRISYSTDRSPGLWSDSDFSVHFPASPAIGQRDAQVWR